jgi:cob(I)alamin adenosyltransferase|tara:strand:- start:56 stop:349 length:294 start_codon:yes stop_codon:yes gene_type:complete
MPLSFEERLKKRLADNRLAFIGIYKDEINALHGLSRAEIDEITPDSTDLEIYDQLIDIVKEASATNESQAALKEQILELGGIAVTIAKKIPQFSELL